MLAWFVGAGGCDAADILCPGGVIAGDVFIRDDAVSVETLDGASAAGSVDDSPLVACSELPGSLWIVGTLSHLRLFDGLVALGGTVSTLATGPIGDGVNDFFPSLTAVHSNFDIPFIEVVGMNNLRSVGGGMYLPHRKSGLQALEEIGSGRTSAINDGELPKLARVHGDFLVASATEAESAFAPPALEYIGGDLLIHSEGRTLTFPALTEVEGNVSLLGSRLGQQVDFPRLLRIGGYLSVPFTVDFRAFDAPALATIGGDVSFVGNQALDELSGLDALETVRGDIEFRGNALLTSQEIARFVDSIESRIGRVTHCGNQDDAVCPDS